MPRLDISNREKHNESIHLNSAAHPARGDILGKLFFNIKLLILMSSLLRHAFENNFIL